MQQVTIYTDGSCLGNPGAGGYAGVIKSGDKEINRVLGGEPNSTNNRMELMAVIESLKVLKEPSVVTIYSDSNYVVNGITTWMYGWQSRNWKNVKNKELWQEYLKVSSKHKVTCNWVKGHNGNPDNELCDKLAKKEAEKIKVSPPKKQKPTTTILKDKVNGLVIQASVPVRVEYIDSDKEIIIKIY